MAARTTCAASPTGPSMTCSTTAGAWRGRSGGCRWGFSAPRTRTQRCPWPTRSVWRCSSPTSCVTSARTTPAAGSTCPPRTSSGSGPSWTRTRPPAPARTSSPRWWSSRRTAHAPGTPRAWRSCPCSTGAAPRPPGRWRGSTSGCSSTSPPARPRCSPAGCPCRPEKRRWSRSGRWPRQWCGRHARAGQDRPARRQERHMTERARAHIAVLGGGLAGITAAIALAEQGNRVTLAEARPRLGGATTSFTRGDLVIDNGQHVLLRCCTAYRGLLARLGMTGSVSLQDRFDVTVLSPGGGRATLRRTSLPGPLHMGRALAGYRHLSVSERLRVVPATLAMTALDPARPDLDGKRLGDWLAARGQSERARRVLWDLFTVSSLNVAGDDANLALAASVVKTALLGAKDAADIGTPAVPLGDLHGRAGADLLGRLGAQVRLGAKATAVEALPTGGFLVRLADRGEAAAKDGSAAGSAAANGSDVIRADGVVLAVPPDVAARLAPGAQPANGAGPWGELGSSPIVNVHVVYDRRVTRLPFAAAVDSPVQWVFDRTGPSGL